MKDIVLPKETLSSGNLIIEEMKHLSVWGARKGGPRCGTQEANKIY